MVSLIIPFSGRKHLMERLFGSLRRMSSADVEVIFVDNNSESETSNAVAEFASELSTQRGITTKVVQETKPGAAAARNKGLDVAQGDYVYFFDSDDVIYSDFLTRAQSLAVQTGAEIVALQTNIVLPGDVVRPKKFSQTANPKVQLVANNFATQSLFLKRSFAVKYARWNEDLPYWNDLEWGFRILLASPTFAWLPGEWHRIYKHEESITGASFKQHISDIMLAHKVIEQDIANSKLPERVKRKLNQALNCRKTLYAGYIKKEGGAEESRLLLESVNKKYCNLFSSIKLTLLYKLSSFGIHGVWRLA